MSVLVIGLHGRSRDQTVILIPLNGKETKTTRGTLLTLAATTYLSSSRLGRIGCLVYYIHTDITLHALDIQTGQKHTSYTINILKHLTHTHAEKEIDACYKQQCKNYFSELLEQNNIVRVV